MGTSWPRNLEKAFAELHSLTKLCIQLAVLHDKRDIGNPTMLFVGNLCDYRDTPSHCIRRRLL